MVASTFVTLHRIRSLMLDCGLCCWRRYADIVVHRQLLAALQQQQQQQQLKESSAGVLLLTPPIPGVWEHSELSAAAAVMNERHRNAKAAQKQCSELYMLDLMHRQPHVESALVVGVQVGCVWRVQQLGSLWAATEAGWLGVKGRGHGRGGRHANTPCPATLCWRSGVLSSPNLVLTCHCCHCLSPVHAR